MSRAPDRRISFEQIFNVQLWAGAAHYPDFLAHEAQSWWKDQIDTFSTMLPVDGIWLDMNEPDNFCSCDVAYDPGRYPGLQKGIFQIKASNVETRCC